MKKGLIISLIVVVLFSTLTIFGVITLSKKSYLINEIPEDYIAVFHGGVGEETHETYIYKINNGKSNMGFSYLNVLSRTESYGSPNWTHRVVGKGEFDFTDGAFIVAEENNAYSYVTRPNDSKIYTIEEFKNMFIMN